MLVWKFSDEETSTNSIRPMAIHEIRSKRGSSWERGWVCVIVAAVVCKSYRERERRERERETRERERVYVCVCACMYSWELRTRLSVNHSLVDCNKARRAFAYGLDWDQTLHSRWTLDFCQPYNPIKFIKWGSSSFWVEALVPERACCVLLIKKNKYNIQKTSFTEITVAI